MSAAQVAVVIPCYRAQGLVGPVVEGVLRIGEELGPACQLRVLVVNDACPQQSWREIAAHPRGYLRLADRQPSR